MLKTYILDTNVLLSDPNSFLSFENSEIILPFTVLEEIDNIKKRPNEVGANAREVVRTLSEFISKNEIGILKRGIKLNNGSVLRIVSFNDFNKSYELTEDWDQKNKDNHILQICKYLVDVAKENKKELPTLVTRDIVLRVKCDVLGIPCEDYKKETIADNLDRLFSGITYVDNIPHEIIQSYWQDFNSETKEFNFIIDDYVNHKLSPNEFVFLRQNPIDNGIPVRYVGENKPVRFVFEPKKPIFGITPRNKEQQLAMDLLLDPEIKLITLIGKAGTGKTICSIAAGLNQVLEKKKYKSLFVCKPVVPVGNDIGYLPGTKEEKLEPWIAPIKDNLRYLLFSGRKTKNTEQTLQNYFDDGIIEVEAITYLRGRSIADAFIIIDEAQNLTVHELKTIITRVGENTKLVLTGDIEQIDNIYVDSLNNGLTIASEKFRPYAIAGHITLTKGERSTLASLASQIL